MSEEQKPPIIVPLGDNEEIVFRHIPAGAFRMGHRGKDPAEEPVTEVFVEEFWMAETPVTRAQYKIMAGWCMEELVKDEEFKGNEPDEIKTEEDGRRPVTKVSWDETRVVARWLTSEMRRQNKLPEGKVVDLPWEAQWEKACRAGLEMDYYSGDGEAALAEVGWFEEDFGGEPFPVKSKPANEWGLSDCHGSVWQWCRDDWGKKRGSARLRVSGETEPRERSDEGEAKYRVLRGGSWNDATWYCRSACRDRNRPGNRDRDCGFRLAVVPGPSESEAGGPSKEAEPKAEGKPRRDDESVPQAVGGAELSEVNFPKRNS